MAVYPFSCVNKKNSSDELIAKLHLAKSSADIPDLSLSKLVRR